MLSSLPSLPPLNAHELYFPSLSSPAQPIATTAVNGADRTANHPQVRAPAGLARSAYTALRADENAILTRKASIRRFGAVWLRPPGVSKTLQGLEDERIEREEVEAAALREQALADAQAAAEIELAAFEAQRPPEDNIDGEQDLDADHDLDADIPDADGLDDTDDMSVAGEDLSGGDGDWVDETDGALPPQDEEGDGDYAAEIHEDVMVSGDMVRDLDDDVPEAGSYQHTDTDVEDSSSSGDHDAPDWGPASILPPGMAAARQSMGGTSLRSSIFGNSPVVDGSRRSQGRRRRSGGG